MSASYLNGYCLKYKLKQMDCRDLGYDIFLYAENLLTGNRKEILERHLVDCKECRDFLGYVKVSLQVLEDEKQTEANPFLSTRILAAKEAEEQLKPVVRRWAPALAFVILFVAAIFGGITLGKLYSQTIASSGSDVQEEMSYIDDLEQEQIETFFMTSNDTNNE